MKKPTECHTARAPALSHPKSDTTGGQTGETLDNLISLTAAKSSAPAVVHGAAMEAPPTQKNVAGHVVPPGSLPPAAHANPGAHVHAAVPALAPAQYDPAGHATPAQTRTVSRMRINMKTRCMKHTAAAIAEDSKDTAISKANAAPAARATCSVEAAQRTVAARGASARGLVVHATVAVIPDRARNSRY